MACKDEYFDEKKIKWQTKIQNLARNFLSKIQILTRLLNVQQIKIFDEKMYYPVASKDLDFDIDNCIIKWQVKIKILMIFFFIIQ